MIDNRWQSALQRERGSLLEACQIDVRCMLTLLYVAGLTWIYTTDWADLLKPYHRALLSWESKVIWEFIIFLFILFRNWLKEFALPSWPIRCNQMHVNCDLITHVFARFRQFACFPLKTHWLLVILIFVMIDCCDDLRYSIYGNLLLITI